MSMWIRLKAFLAIEVLKGQVIGILSKYIHMIHNQFGIVIKTIRLDNGAKFLSNECYKLLTDKGKTHYRSCPYIPQQNGVEKENIDISWIMIKP